MALLLILFAKKSSFFRIFNKVLKIEVSAYPCREGLFIGERIVSLHPSVAYHNNAAL